MTGPLNSLLSTVPHVVTAGPDRKSLVVSARAEDQERVAKFIKDFDKPTPDQEPVERLYRLRFSQAGGLAGSLQTLFATDGVTRISFDGPNNAVIVYAVPAVHDRVRRLIDEFDTVSQGAPPHRAGFFDQERDRQRRRGQSASLVSNDTEGRRFPPTTETKPSSPRPRRTWDRESPRR